MSSLFCVLEEFQSFFSGTGRVFALYFPVSKEQETISLMPEGDKKLYFRCRSSHETLFSSRKRVVGIIHKLSEPRRVYIQENLARKYPSIPKTTDSGLIIGLYFGREYIYKKTALKNTIFGENGYFSIKKSYIYTQG